MLPQPQAFHMLVYICLTLHTLLATRQRVQKLRRSRPAWRTHERNAMECVDVNVTAGAFWKAVGSHVWRRTQCYATRVIWRDGSLAWLHLTSCTSTSINFYDRITGLSRVFMSGERPDLCTSRYLKCKVSQTCFPTTCVQPVGELPQESERKVPSFPVVAGLDFSPPDDVTKG